MQGVQRRVGLVPATTVLSIADHYYIAIIISDNYIGHNYTEHDCTGHYCICHNYIGHNYRGHSCTGHNYIGHNYIKLVPATTALSLVALRQRRLARDRFGVAYRMSSADGIDGIYMWRCVPSVAARGL